MPSRASVVFENQQEHNMAANATDEVAVAGAVRIWRVRRWVRAGGADRTRLRRDNDRVPRDATMSTDARETTPRGQGAAAEGVARTARGRTGGALRGRASND